MGIIRRLCGSVQVFCQQNDKLKNIELIPSGANTTHAFVNGLVSTCYPCIVFGERFYSKRQAERITGISRHSI